MKNPYKIKAYPFLLWWIISSVIVYPITAIALGLVMLPSGMLFETFAPRVERLSPYGTGYSYSVIADPAIWVGTLFAIAIVGGIIGLVLGHLQRRLFRSRLYWAADKWRLMSVIGGIIGGYLAMGALYLNNEVFNRPPEMNILIGMVLFITPVAIAQLFALREAVKQPYLWVLANLVGGIVFGGVLVMNQPDYYASNADFIWLGNIALAVIGQGLITGFVGLTLFERHSLLPNRYEDESESETPRSVWDRAI